MGTPRGSNTDTSHEQSPSPRRSVNLLRRGTKPCPACSKSLNSDTALYPNNALLRILASTNHTNDRAVDTGQKLGASSRWIAGSHDDPTNNIDLDSLSSSQQQKLLLALLKRQNTHDQEVASIGAELALDFLIQARQMRRDTRDSAQRDLEIIDHDLTAIVTQFPNAGIALSQEVFAELSQALPDHITCGMNHSSGRFVRGMSSSSSQQNLETVDSQDSCVGDGPAGSRSKSARRMNYPGASTSFASMPDIVDETSGPEFGNEIITVDGRNPRLSIGRKETESAGRPIQTPHTGLGFNGLLTNTPYVQRVRARKSLVDRFHADVQSMYFDRRRRMGTAGLQSIMDTLLCATSLSVARKRACVKQVDIFNAGQNLISSVKFNAGGTIFATGGVAKRIKLFDLGSVLNASQEHASSAESLHCPILEIATQSKLTALSWSQEKAAILAAVAFNGSVLVYDTDSSTELHHFTEHNVRTWSVDFSTQEPTLLLSGSDDKTVRLWDVGRSSQSVLTLPTGASVCSVKFNPYASHEIAFGSADHNVYSYDIRHPSSPLCVFEGHWRAVSYVLFLNRSDLVSASTDSSCKLWNAREQEPGLNYGGHKNERNFVGLCGNGDFFACGSEDNAVYIYHKGLAGPVMRYGLASPGIYASTISWKPGSNMLVTANNTGALEIFELE